MNCTVSFKISLAECCESIVVAGGLLANTAYAWLVTDKNGLEYYEYVVTDGSGNFTIDCSLFPSGSLNRASGWWTLEVFRFYPYYYNDGLPSDLTFCGDEYDSVLFSFVSKTTTQDTSIQYIKCV